MFSIVKGHKGYHVLHASGLLIRVCGTVGEARAVISAIEHLIAWSAIRGDADFNALSRDAIIIVGTAVVNAVAAYRADTDARKAERRTRLNADDARFRAGVPYADAPKAKPYMMNPDGTYKVTVGGRPWYTDGYIALEGDAPDYVEREVPIEQVIPTRFEREIAPVAFFVRGATRVAVMDDGTMLYYDMYEHLSRRFKGATVHGNGTLGPIGFIVDGRTVAIMMPLNPEAKGFVVPGAVRDMLGAVSV